MTLNYERLRLLEAIPNQIREDAIKMLLEAGSGHSAGSLSTDNIFGALQFNVIRHDPKDPARKDLDRFY